MISPTKGEEVAVPVFLTQAARKTAQQFAQQQPSSAKAQQVQLNTLAVYAVNNYLKILGIPADPSNCDSWNPLMRMTTNVADLEIRGRGRIECRPISSSEAGMTCYVPAEVQGDRMAYLVVQVEPEQPQALILGFAEQIENESLPLSQLRPMSELPSYLESYASNTLDRVTRLAQWAEGQIGAGWQTLETLLGITAPAYQWRSRTAADSLPPPSKIIRGQAVELTTARGKAAVALIVELSPKPKSNALDIALKVAPLHEQTFLPAGLSMAVLDAADEPVMQAQAREENRSVELSFHAEAGDRFQLKLELGEAAVVESFVV